MPHSLRPAALRSLHHQPVPPDRAIDRSMSQASRLRTEIDSSPGEIDTRSVPWTD